MTWLRRIEVFFCGEDENEDTQLKRKNVSLFKKLTGYYSLKQWFYFGMGKKRREKTEQEILLRDIKKLMRKKNREQEKLAREQAIEKFIDEVKEADKHKHQSK